MKTEHYYDEILDIFTLYYDSAAHI